MKRTVKISAVVLACVLGLTALAGCSGQSQKADVNANVPEGAAPTMPAGHEGRYDSLGADGCYGCHGAGENANPMLFAATALPENHYTVETPASNADLDPGHSMCNTCHVSGTGK